MEEGGDGVRRLSDATIELVAERFRLLAEPTRLKILQSLREGERTVGELVERVETGQANVSKHLGLLRRHGLVSRRKEGVNVHYSIADPLVFELCELVCDRLAEEAEERRETLAGES